MTARKAAKIVGFPFQTFLNPAHTPLPTGTKPLRPVWVCTGTNPEYGYLVQSWNEQQHLAVKAFVDQNYREIGLIVCREQGFRCAGCGRYMPGLLEIDHIVMRSHGRLDARKNLRALGSSAAVGGCRCHDKRHSVTNWRPQEEPHQ